MLHTTVEVSKLQWLGKILSAEVSLTKAMKELQENGSKLAQLFHSGFVVVLPSLMCQLQFITHFTEKAAPKAFVQLYYFPCSLTKTSVSYADSLQYLPLGEIIEGSFSG